MLNPLRAGCEASLT